MQIGKTKILAVLFSTLMTMNPTWARLGWSLEQCKKEYGKPYLMEEDKVSFRTSGGRTVIVYLDSKKIVQVFDVFPVNKSEALFFKDELGSSWLTSEKYPDIALMQGIQWTYLPSKRRVSLSSQAGQALTAKKLAGWILTQPATDEAPVPVPAVESPKGLTSPRQIRRVFVASLGDDGESRLLREKVRAELLKTKKFEVVDAPTAAQAIVQGAVATRSYTSAYGSSFEGDGWVKQDTTFVTSSTLRVTDSLTDKTLWTWEYQPARFAFGPFAFGDTSVSKAFARDLVKVVYGQSKAEDAPTERKATLGPKRN
jgi:hypothetical protein